jgi:hypothetical protein
MDFKLVKIAFLASFMISWVESKCQNLSFSQVVTYSGLINYSSPTAGIVDGPVYTVPEGKIWKIEYLNIYFSGTSADPEYMSYKINGNRIFCSIITQTALYVNDVKLPIWLKAGDTIRPSYGSQYSNNSYNFNYPYFISILEFNAP